MVNVVFLHPDLGIGGAERLVVDAAVALRSHGHFVHFVTNHHDKNHCFEETKSGVLPVVVVGDWLPRSIFGMFFALCAYLRMIYAAFYLAFFSDIKPDVIFCDQVSLCVPVLHLRFPHVIFYCHFPDQALSKPGGILKTLYRKPLNYLEEKTTNCADKVFVNSKFTKSVFKSIFKGIKKEPDVLYPSINTNIFDRAVPKSLDKVLEKEFPPNRFVFLSINRYERKKDHQLALQALHKLKNLISAEEFSRIYLIIAGGYDKRVDENVNYYAELVVKADDLKISSQVIFLKSPSDEDKFSILMGCDCLLYTPVNEHFGIVPLEAMYANKPVIASNSGGPTETVVDGETGFLRNPDAAAYARAMEQLFRNPGLGPKLGAAGRKRFRAKFSFTAFSNQLDAVIQEMLNIE